MNPGLDALVRERRHVLDGVRRILIDALGVRREPDEIDPDTPLFGTGLGLDSVDGVELLVAIETSFGVRVPNESVRVALRTVNTVVDAIGELKASDDDG
jgi:acyl carrier protein